MQPFTISKGIAAAMPAANIDTDVIMPKQFLKGIDRNGLGRGVFFNTRFLSDGQKNPAFILNQSPWDQARFLVVGPNFGCGSSREHAVWGLKQIGIQALIGSSFAGIFFDNCQRNGVLLVQLKESEVQEIAKAVNQPDSSEITINLIEELIYLQDGSTFSFNIDPICKESLLLGLDAIGSTLQKTETIRSFESEYLLDNPWLA